MVCGTTKTGLGSSSNVGGFHGRKRRNVRSNRKNHRLTSGWKQSFQPWKKKIEAGETVVWADEVGISMKPVIGNTWATRGNTPTIFAKTNWEKLSVIGGITSQGQFFQQTHEGSIKAPGFISFLTHLLRHIEGKLTVVVDNAKIHRAKIVMEFVAKHERLTITHLPPYSPELNPIELVWAYVKRHCLANFCPENLGQLKALSLIHI